MPVYKRVGINEFDRVDGYWRSDELNYHICVPMYFFF